MAELKINYGTLGTWAHKINEQNEVLKETLVSIQKTITALEGEWESNAAVKVREKITNMTPRFEQYYDVVNNYAVFLNNTAEEWRNTEMIATNNTDQFL